MPATPSTNAPLINPANKHNQISEFTGNNSKNKIKSHDIVYFMHTKAGGLVSSTLAKPTQYYLK